VPITQKHGSFTALFTSFGSGPFNKIQTVIIVTGAVGFQAKVNVGEDRSLPK
jgi:hypothetical protein